MPRSWRQTSPTNLDDHAFLGRCYESVLRVGAAAQSSGSVLWAADDLTGVREATAETEQQDGAAGRDLAPLEQLRQRERDTRRRRVARFDDVARDDRVLDAELAGERLDDPQVRLVRHERGELAWIDAGLLAHLPGQRWQRVRRPAEHRLAGLLDVRAPPLDLDHVVQLRR